MPIRDRVLRYLHRKISDALSIKSPKKARVNAAGFAFVEGGGGRDVFEEYPASFDDIVKAYNTDSYVRQAIDKYVELMFKSGWVLKGTNEKAVQYIRQRFAIMGLQTGIPIDELLIMIAEDLVKFCNVFILKARIKPDQGITIPGLKAIGVGGLNPIGGYFILPPNSIHISRDEHGNVLEYRQEVPGQTRPFRIKPYDMIHIKHKAERGNAFGNPFLSPTIDDVRLLREVEENIARLVHRHLHPLYVYTIGIAQPGFEATDDEIERMKQEIENMPTEGGLVVPERHKVEALGAQGQAMDASEYLRYYEQRVFTGLGLPETVMGRGDTSNRGTSDNLSAEARDRIKAFQKVQEIYINASIITELLLEGGFDPTNEEDLVTFQFNEIDIDNKVKLETHANQLWLSDLIDHNEARQMIGKDPLDGDMSLMRSTLVGTASAAQAAQADSIIRPANQYGKKASPKAKESVEDNPSKEDQNVANNINKQEFSQSMSNRGNWNSVLRIDEYTSKLIYHYSLTRDDVVDLVALYYKDTDVESFDTKELSMIMALTRQSIERVARTFLEHAIDQGIDKCISDTAESKPESIDSSTLIYNLLEMCKEDVELVFEDLSQAIVKAVKSSTSTSAIEKVIGVFGASSYRMEFMARTQLMRAYNLGYALCAAHLDLTELTVVNNGGCAECKKRAGKIRLSGDIYKKVPPWHSNCWCYIKSE